MEGGGGAFAYLSAAKRLGVTAYCVPHTVMCGRLRSKRGRVITNYGALISGGRLSYQETSRETHLSPTPLIGRSLAGT